VDALGPAFTFYSGALSCDKQYGWSSCLRTAIVVIGTIWPRWPETEPLTVSDVDNCFFLFNFWTSFDKRRSWHRAKHSNTLCQIENLTYNPPWTQSRLNVFGGLGPARLVGPLLSLWPTWRGGGRSTLYQRIRQYTLRSQSGPDMMSNYDLRNGA